MLGAEGLHHQCLLCAQKQTFSNMISMSAKCQKRTNFVRSLASIMVLLGSKMSPSRCRWFRPAYAEIGKKFRSTKRSRAPLKKGPTPSGNPSLS
jgi:hypothetical protein